MTGPAAGPIVPGSSAAGPAPGSPFGRFLAMVALNAALAGAPGWWVLLPGAPALIWVLRQGWTLAWLKALAPWLLILALPWFGAFAEGFDPAEAGQRSLRWILLLSTAWVYGRLQGLAELPELARRLARPLGPRLAGALTTALGLTLGFFPLLSQLWTRQEEAARLRGLTLNRHPWRRAGLQTTALLGQTLIKTVQRAESLALRVRDFDPADGKDP